MKKIILSVWLLLSSTICYAENVILHVPSSDTGTFQAINRVILDGLKQKGWNIDIRVTGNPKFSKDVYTESKEPFILSWSTATASSKQDSHYLVPPDKNNFIGFTHTYGLSLCSINDISKKELTEKSYKIAITQEAYMKRWVDNFQKYLDSKHTFIQYTGSARVVNALFSKEVDMAFISSGPSYAKGGKLKCILTTGNQDIVDIPTMKKLFSNYEENELIFGQYWQAKNLSEKQLQKLRKDFLDIIKNYNPYLDYINSKFFSSINYNIEKQIEVIQLFDSKIE